MNRLLAILGGLLALFAATFAGIYFGMNYLEKHGIELVKKPLAYDYVLKNGTIVDGTGKKGYQADIGIKKGKIAFIGIIQPPAKVKVIDASGLLILPGFVDLHSRLDGTMDGPDAFDNLIKQGVTTVLSGYGDIAQDDVTLHLQQAAKAGLPVNYALLAGHQGLFKLLKPEEKSDAVVAEETPLEFGQIPPPPAVKEKPKPAVEDLIQELQTSLDQGAYGLSIDFDDELGRQLTFDEIRRLAKALEERGAILALNLPATSSDPAVLLKRVIDLHRETKARVLMAPWGYFGNATDARVADMEQDLQAGYLSSRNIYTTLYPSNRQPAGVRQTLQRAVTLYPPEMIEIAEAGGQNPPNLVGKTLQEIAQERGAAPGVVAREMASAGLVRIVLRTTTLERIDRLAGSPFVSLTVDSGMGSATQYSPDALKEFLGRSVRDQNKIPWEEAALKLSGRPSALLGLEDRGTVEKGKWADLVLIDPKLLPPSTEKKSGIRHVFVNGALAFSKGKMLQEGQGKGQLLRFKGKPIMPEPAPEPKTSPVPGPSDEEEEE
ncbi:amidohydrolase family protein [Heliobacterium gestii]|uniref:Amidohydrolase family protein n=1 Tax=Heliomicrobium gestii TaxID=2699 RepID=A0A845LEK2_HELGE|nr:amidohydrolase family protein [Heliomicrobium gestii]MBM7867597.1 N-acyl-D-aspartate/D-glutamate deacylase [Heliomicrobium gestii]MZP43991.1 amidohydrolase family protein [Heliomicrobium gestii]